MKQHTVIVKTLTAKRQKGVCIQRFTIFGKAPIVHQITKEKQT